MTQDKDIVDLLLAGSKVPPVAADLTTRIVAAAERPGRERTSLPPRRQAWRRARRGAWTAVIAINILLAGAVAAAIGGGARYLPAPIARATHHIVERLRTRTPLFGHARAHPVRRETPPALHASRTDGIAPQRPVGQARLTQRTIAPPSRILRAPAPLRDEAHMHRRPRLGGPPIGRPPLAKSTLRRRPLRHRDVARFRPGPRPPETRWRGGTRNAFFGPRSRLRPWNPDFGGRRWFGRRAERPLGHRLEPDGRRWRDPAGPRARRPFGRWPGGRHFR